MNTGLGSGWKTMQQAQCNYNCVSNYCNFLIMFLFFLVLCGLVLNNVCRLVVRGYVGYSSARLISFYVRKILPVSQHS